MAIIRINKIERSKRKTIALLVHADTTLTVKAPFLVPTNQIENVVEKKQSWIKRKVREFEQRPRVAIREFVNGEGFLVQGKSYRLKIGSYPSIELGEYLYFPKSDLDSIRQKLTDWYKQQGLKKIVSRTKWYYKKMGVEYSSIRLSDATKRWGSCGRNNTLSIIWRLIMAPLKIIDYVIVHELSHTDEKNHSMMFWNKVKTVLHDYEKSREWLRNNGNILNL